MIYFINNIDDINRINWRLRIWGAMELSEEIAFKKLYKEYVKEDFP